MILVHRLRGEPMFLNEDLIESIEATPDTVVTLVDGRKLVLADGPQDLVDRARRYRASVLVAVEEMRQRAGAPLRVLPGGAAAAPAEPERDAGEVEGR